MQKADSSIQKVLLQKWEHEWDGKLKAHIERISEEMGCTRQEVVMEHGHLFPDGQGEHWNPDA